MVRHLREHYAPALIFGSKTNLKTKLVNGTNEKDDDGDDGDDGECPKSFLLEIADQFIRDNSLKQSKAGKGSPHERPNGEKESKGKLGKNDRMKGKRKSGEGEKEEMVGSKKQSDSGPTEPK